MVLILPLIPNSPITPWPRTVSAKPKSRNWRPTRSRSSGCKKILSAGVNIPENEMRESYEQAYAKMEVSVVRFQSAELEKDAQVSDEEVTKAYEARKASLKSDEKRQVKFVQFALTEEQKKLTGKERIDVLQKLADKANDFDEALQGERRGFRSARDQVQTHSQRNRPLRPDHARPASRVRPAARTGRLWPDARIAQQRRHSNAGRLRRSPPAEDRTGPSPYPRRSETETGGRTEETKNAAARRAESESDGRAIAGGDEERPSRSPKPLPPPACRWRNCPPFALADKNRLPRPAASPVPKKDSPDMPYIKRAASKLKPGEVSDFVYTPGWRSGRRAGAAGEDRAGPFRERARLARDPRDGEPQRSRLLPMATRATPRRRHRGAETRNRGRPS